MREKLSGIIGNRAHDIHIHTFHSFASSIIAEFPEHFIEISDMKQFDEEGIGQEIIIRNILNDTKFNDLTPLGKPDMYIRSIISAISEAKKNNMSPDMVEAYAKKEIKIELTPKDPLDKRNIIVEIRAGAGGGEAALSGLSDECIRRSDLLWLVDTLAIADIMQQDSLVYLFDEGRVGKKDTRPRFQLPEVIIRRLRDL